MILVKIKGGLGNQMFQYAAGKSLSLRLNVPLYLTENIYKFEKINSESECFFPSANYTMCSPSLIKSFEIESFTKSFLEMLGFSRKGVFEEHSFFFNDEFKSLKSSTFIKGFWQSEKYFIENEDVIRECFNFYAEPEFINNKIREKIISNNSVAVHIRRGDYITDIGNLKKHGVCPIEYYKQSFEILENKTNDPYYFIFTDDKQWAIDNILPLRNKISVIEGNEGFNSWKDMYLMSLCKHNIIANSTFSWWGAWLNINSNKIVISPKRWFATPALNQQTFDLIPSTWMRI